MARTLAVFLAIGAATALAQGPDTRAQSGAIAIGHESRQDDSPALAAAPDGSLWAVWLSFDGNRDDLAIRQYAQGQWKNLQSVPGTSGDNWLPQVAVDARNRVWIEPLQQRIQFRDSGPMAGRHYYYVRAQPDDDRLAWSSPMFVNSR